MELEWWIPILVSAIVGLIAALGFGLQKALQPIFEEIYKVDEKGNLILDKKGNKIVEQKILKEKAGTVTKTEWMTIGNGMLSGAFYGAVVTAVMAVINWTPANTAWYLILVFGTPTSVQFVAVMAGITLASIYLGLHAKSKMWAVVSGAFVAQTAEISEKIGKKAEDLVKAGVDKISADIKKTVDETSKAIDDVTDQLEDDAEETLEELEETEPIVGESTIEVEVTTPAPIKIISPAEATEITSEPKEDEDPARQI